LGLGRGGPHRLWVKTPEDITPLSALSGAVVAARDAFADKAIEVASGDVSRFSAADRTVDSALRT